MQATYKEIITGRAKNIFTANTRTGYCRRLRANYRFISPAGKEYVYQWLWDTAFHAIVLANFDTEWAKNEINNFLAAQFPDGFLPHVIFWDDDLLAMPHWAYIESRPGVFPKTSAITQPPALALAAEVIYNRDGDREFLRNVLPKLAAFHH